MTCNHMVGRRCSLNLFGGKPSPGVCLRCDQYSGRPRGAGDLVEVITEKTGIKKAVEKVAGKGCGCRKRRDRLNKLLPFRGE